MIRAPIPGSGGTKYSSLILPLALLVWTNSSKADERLFLDATINGKPVKLFFDTGASGSILFTKAVERLGLTYTNAPRNVHVAAGKLPAGETEECDLVLGRNAFRTT